ncbi:MAG: hypothetical protein ABR985_07105 [Methanotrichaceae archaeon]
MKLWPTPLALHVTPFIQDSGPGAPSNGRFAIFAVVHYERASRAFCRPVEESLEDSRKLGAKIVVQSSS